MNLHEIFKRTLTPIHRINVDARVNLCFLTLMDQSLEKSDGTRQRTYTISQLSREFDVTPRALRFYEDKGLLSPNRSGMKRIYSVRDRARLKLVLSGRKVGFSLNDLREILDLYDLDDNQRAQLRTALKKHKQQIDALNQQRLEIEEALTALHEGVSWIEDKLSRIEPGPGEADTMRAYEAMARSRLRDDHHD